MHFWTNLHLESLKAFAAKCVNLQHGSVNNTTNTQCQSSLPWLLFEVLNPLNFQLMVLSARNIHPLRVEKISNSQKSKLILLVIGNQFVRIYWKLIWSFRLDSYSYDVSPWIIWLAIYFLKYLVNLWNFWQLLITKGYGVLRLSLNRVV